MLHMISGFLFLGSLNAPSHSLVDTLGMNYMCCFKVGVTFRHTFERYIHV